MQRPGSWITVFIAVAVVGGLAFLARAVLKGDPAAPPAAVTPTAPRAADAPPPAEPPAVATAPSA